MTPNPFLRAVAACALFMALSACAGDKVWMRSGSSSLDGETEEMSCAEQAESSGGTVTFGDAPVQPDRFSQRYACLRSRGFKLKSLSSEESTKLKSLGGVDREIYWNELLKKNGFSGAVERPEPALPQSNLPLASNKPAKTQ